MKVEATVQTEHYSARELIGTNQTAESIQVNIKYSNRAVHISTCQWGIHALEDGETADHGFPL